MRRAPLLWALEKIGWLRSGGRSHLAADDRISLKQDVALGVTVPSRQARARCADRPALDQILANHGYPPALEQLLPKRLVLTALLGSLLKDPGDN